MLKNSKDKSDSKIIKYFALSNYDINDIKKNLICFNNVVLSMIRNAVVVLPNDRKNNGVQNINNLYNIKKNINDFYYEEFVDTKKVFLSCIKVFVIFFNSMIAAKTTLLILLSPAKV